MINTAIIYTRSSPMLDMGQELVVKRQEESCRACAKANGIEIIGVFQDMGTDVPPHQRVEFIEMFELIRAQNQPIMVLVESYFTLSANSEHIPKAFHLIHSAHGSTIWDIASMDHEARLTRFQQEAEMDVLLADLCSFMQQLHVQSGRYWERVCEVGD